MVRYLIYNLIFCRICNLSRTSCSMLCARKLWFC